MTEPVKGSCLCGSITYEVTTDLHPVCACHCNQCRKVSGNYVTATKCDSNHLHIKGNSLTWFKSSDTAERGFCATCGSNLFWRRYASKLTSIWAGSIDGPTGLKMTRQIHPDTKGDYYDLPDVPIVEQSTLE